MAMERCPDAPLSDIVDTMSPSQLDHIAKQLKAFLARIEIDIPLRIQWVQSLVVPTAMLFGLMNLLQRNLLPLSRSSSCTIAG